MFFLKKLIFLADGDSKITEDSPSLSFFADGVFCESLAVLIFGDMIVEVTAFEDENVVVHVNIGDELEEVVMARYKRYSESRLF